jgi:hypothetical protein
MSDGTGFVSPWTSTDVFNYRYIYHGLGGRKQGTAGRRVMDGSIVGGLVWLRSSVAGRN